MANRSYAEHTAKMEQSRPLSEASDSRPNMCCLTYASGLTGISNCKCLYSNPHVGQRKPFQFWFKVINPTRVFNVHKRWSGCYCQPMRWFGTTMHVSLTLASNTIIRDPTIVSLSLDNITLVSLHHSIPKLKNIVRTQLTHVLIASNPGVGCRNPEKVIQKPTSTHALIWHNDPRVVYNFIQPRCWDIPNA